MSKIATVAVASLFSADNPFRRKPDSPQPQAINPTTPSPSSLEPKKRKRDKKTPVEQPEPDSNVPKKRKDGNGDAGSPRKKRKRQEMEEEGIVVERSDLGVKVGAKRKAEEESKSLVVSKEAFDDEDKLARTVFVGNLPLKTKRKVLLKEFGAFGEIESVRIRSVPIEETKAPRKNAILQGKINQKVGGVNAYIVYKEEHSAQAALEHNMAVIGGNHIRVDKACPPRKKLKGEAPIYSVKKTVFVGNLPYDVKDEEVYKLFCGDNQSESNVEAIRVIKDPKSRVGKGIAYIMFKTRESANSVVKKEVKLRNRVLRLSHAAKPDTTPSKRRLVSPGDTGSKKRAFSASIPKESKFKVKADSVSYQGLRSSKSGVHKKVSRTVLQGKQSSGGTPAKPEGKRKRLNNKRPAVAERKEKSLKEGEKKRKLENGLPEATHKNKKARHFK